MPKMGDVFTEKEYNQRIRAGYTDDEIFGLAKEKWKEEEPKRHEAENQAYANEREKVRATSLLKDDGAIDKHFEDRFNPLNEDGTTRKIDKTDPSYNAYRRGKVGEINAETQKEIEEYNKNNNVYGKGQGVLDRFIRGVDSAQEEDKMVVNHSLGNEQSPVTLKLVNDARKLDDEYTKSQQSPERQKETELLAKGYEEAEGFVDTVSTGASLLWDKAMNLDEANIAGAIGSMATPLNLVASVGTGGLGTVASKAVTGVAKKAVVGGVVGAAADAAYNSDYEHTSAKAQGKSDDEAQKAGIMGAMTGLAMGATLGSVGAIATRTKVKLQEKYNIDSGVDSSSESILKTNAQIQEMEKSIEMVHAEAVKSQPIIENIAKNTKTSDEFNQQVMNLVPPRVEELETSLIINNNQEVSPRFAGSRVRNALEKSIENPSREPQQMFEVLKAEGFTEETAGVITSAYEKKDVGIFDEFVAQKMADNFDKEVIAPRLAKEQELEIETKNKAILDEELAVDTEVSSKVSEVDAVPNTSKAEFYTEALANKNLSQEEKDLFNDLLSIDKREKEVATLSAEHQKKIERYEKDMIGATQEQKIILKKLQEIETKKLNDSLEVHTVEKLKEKNVVEVKEEVKPPADELLVPKKEEVNIEVIEKTASLEKDELKVEHVKLSENPKENIKALHELDEKVYPKEHKFSKKVEKDYDDAKTSIATQSKKGFVLNPWSADVRKIAKYHYLRGADSLTNFATAMKTSLGKSWEQVKPMIQKLFEKTYNAVENWSTEHGTRGQMVRTILGRSYAVANDASFEPKAPKQKPNNNEPKVAKGDFEVDSFDTAIKDMKEYSELGGNGYLEKFKPEIYKKYQNRVDKLFDTMEKGFEYAVDRKFDRKAKETGATKDKLKAMGAKTLRAWVAVEKETKIVRDIQNDLMIKTAEISRVGNDLKVSLEGLAKKDSQALVQVLNGDADVAVLKPEIRKIYDKFRAMIDHNANELIKLGALDKDSKIEHYVKRYYEKYVDDTENANIVSKLYHGTVKGRKSLTHEERLQMGMLEDASFVVTNTIVEQRKQILKARLLKQIADEYGKDTEVKHYVQISDERVKGSNDKIKKYGALAGKWVPEEVDAALKQGETISSGMDFFSKYLFPLVDHVKVNMTVKNLTTHLFNVASNMQIAMLKGDLINLGQVLLMAKSNPERFKKLVQTANSYGLDSQLDEIEFQVVFDKKDKKPNIMKSILQRAAKELYSSADSTTGRVLRKAYDWEDKIFKLASFYGEIKGKNLNHADGKVAFKRATGDYVDYSTAMPWMLRAVDKGGVLPFAHYTYKATPKVAKLSLKHPLNFAIMQGVLAWGGASLLFNEDNDHSKPDYAKDNAFDSLANTPLAGKITNLFFVKNWGEVGDGEYTFNYGRSVPGVRIGPLSLDFGFWKSVVNIAVNHEDGLGRKLESKDSLGTHLGLEDESYGKQGIDKGIAFGETFLPTMFPLGRYAGRALRKAGGVHKPLNDAGEELGWNEFVLRILGVRKFDKERHLEEAMKKAQADAIEEDKTPEEIKEVLAPYIEYADKRDLRYVKKELVKAAKREHKNKNEDDKLYKELQKMVKVKQGDSMVEIRAYVQPFIDKEKEEGRVLSSHHKKLLRGSIKRASRYYD